MSVEKFNSRTKVTNEIVPYTQINTKVIQTIDYMEAYCVWSYLLSKPSDWKVIKSHIKNHFNIGDSKLKKIFAYLTKHNLVRNVAVRTEDGTKISHFDIQVLNGDKFINPREISTGSDINPLETYTNRFSGTTKNRVLTKERKKQNSSANEFAQAWELFWKAYPVKKNKSRAMTTFKSKKLYKQIDVILKHIEQSTKTDKKWLDGYIPHPSTYLNGKRWEDEIETVTGFDQSPSKPYVSNNIIEPLESNKPISNDVSNSYMKNFKSA